MPLKNTYGSLKEKQNSLTSAYVNHNLSFQHALRYTSSLLLFPSEMSLGFNQILPSVYFFLCTYRFALVSSSAE